jgi:tRNA(adenine34) deaminase
MRMALEQAAAAPPGDVPVGAVVLSRDGGVLAAAANRREADADPAGHAEIIAMRATARARGRWRLDGCTLVVTLEPCVMCAGAIAAARVGRLVYGAPDERAGAAGSAWDLLDDRRLGPEVEIIGGVLAAECADLLSAFFRELRNTSPGRDV